MGKVLETKGKTSWVQLSGQAYWCKLFESNMDRDPEYSPTGQTMMQITASPETLKVLGQVKSSLSPKIVSDKAGVPDGMYLTLRRKFVNPQIPSKGGVPRVIGPDGEAWDQSQLIWNGAEVEVIVEVYEYGNQGRKGSRLEAVKVIQNGEEPEDYGDKEDTGDQPMNLPF